MFSSKHSISVLDSIVEAIERSCSNSKERERIFDHLIGSDELMHLTDIDFHVLDLNVLLPPPKQNKVSSEAPKAMMKIKESQKNMPVLTYAL